MINPSSAEDVLKAKLNLSADLLAKTKVFDINKLFSKNIVVQRNTIINSEES